MNTYVISSVRVVNQDSPNIKTNLRELSTSVAYNIKDNGGITNSGLSLQFQFTDFLFLLLILLSASISFVKISGKKYYDRILMSITNFSYSNSFFKEKNLAYNIYNVLLTGVFIISFSILLLVLSDYYNLKAIYDSSRMQFLFYFVIACMFIIFHNLVYYTLGLLSDNIIIYKKYKFFFFNLLRVLGSILVFLLFGAVFAENTVQSIFITILFIVMFAAYVLRFYRIILIFFENQFSLYYMILYFCALEIIPILLIYKIILNNFIK